MTDWDKAVATGFRRALKLSGRSMRGLSHDTGIPYRSLQNYFSGTSKMPAGVLLQLCEALGVNSDYIFHRHFSRSQTIIREAVWETFGEAVLKAQPNNVPLSEADLTERQSRALDDLISKLNAHYNRIAEQRVAEFGAWMEEDYRQHPGEPAEPSSD